MHEILKYLKTQGERLDTEIAEAMVSRWLKLACNWQSFLPRAKL